MYTGMARAPKPAGVLFASFKAGKGEQERNGRFFNSYSEDSLTEMLARHPGLTVERAWRTADQRPGRSGECWVNVLARVALQ